MHSSSSLHYYFSSTTNLNSHIISYHINNKKDNDRIPITMFPNPSDLAKEAKKGEGSVEQLGTISVEELNKYHCNNEERRLLSLFGTIFDVTSSEKGYGKDGACKFKK